jgi:hypothetical protein
MMPFGERLKGVNSSAPGLFTPGGAGSESHIINGASPY